MLHNTINTLEVVEHFRRLMHRESEMRVFCLTGESKMGKSHLLTKVFPDLAQKEFQARYAIADLRYRLHDIPKTLEMIANALDTHLCPHYAEAQQNWIRQASEKPKVEVHGVRAFFSRFLISVKESVNDPDHRNLDLTTQLVKDIRALNDKPLLLLFDSVNSAAEDVQSWLMDTFLVKILHFPHVRVVVAGRSLLEANGAYVARYGKYHLHPVNEIDEYISYCQRVNTAGLPEQSIRDLAKACKYVPGHFADLASEFVEQEAIRG